MSFPVEIDYARWGRKRWFHDLDGFLALNQLRSGLHLIDFGAVELGLLVRNRRASSTFYGFHAAQSPVTRRPVPYFQGRKIAPSGLNTVLVSDPSLYLHDDVRVGWFLGSKHVDMPAIWPRIMDKCDALMRANGPRLLWGNSAGGTAALIYARPQDASVVMNPQIVLRNFTWSRVQPWLLHGWDIEEYFEGLAYGEKYLDLRDRVTPHRIVYCQNRHDDHVELQLKPLAETLSVSIKPGDDGRFRLILGDWGSGHIPPPSEEQARYVAEEAAKLCVSRRRWQWLFGIG